MSKKYHIYRYDIICLKYNSNVVNANVYGVNGIFATKSRLLVMNKGDMRNQCYKNVKALACHTRINQPLF